MVYYHGGAFVLRDRPSTHRLAQVYAESIRCKVVIVHYRLGAVSYTHLDVYKRQPSDIVYVAGTINEVDTVWQEINGQWYGYADAVEDLSLIHI